MNAVSLFLRTFARKINIQLMNAKDFFGKFISPYLLGHLIAMVVVAVLLCVGVWYGLRVYTHHGEGVEIPDLMGMSSREARQELERRGLFLEVNDSGYNKSKPAGCILAQLPGAGMQVKAGRTIYVTINSLESPRIAIPDLIDNSSYRQAQAHLQAIGFKLFPPIYVEGEKDWVYGIKQGNCDLQTGDMVSTEQMLTLVIGMGVEDEEGEVLGDSVEATLKLENGIVIGDVDDFEEVTDDDEF